MIYDFVLLVHILIFDILYDYCEAIQAMHFLCTTQLSNVLLTSYMSTI